MDKSNSVHNPIVPRCKLMKDEDGINVDKTYLTTQPGIMFVASLISRYMENPTELHLPTTKWVLHYLKETFGLGIFYRKGGDDDFVAYTVIMLEFG